MSSFLSSGDEAMFDFAVPISGWAANNTATNVSFAGKVVQRVHQVYTTYTSTASVIPWDDTIPQNTEGTEIITASITPTSASSKVVVILNMPYYVVGGNYGVACLFRDSVADALQVTMGSAGFQGFVGMEYEESAGSTSSRTYKVRVGPAQTDTMYLNGNNGGRKHGGVMAITLTLVEILP
jgi:hypothetical protein